MFMFQVFLKKGAKQITRKVYHHDPSTVIQTYNESFSYLITSRTDWNEFGMLVEQIQ